MDENELSNKIIGIAIDVHRNLGAGLLESAYEAALEYELEAAGFRVKRQLSIPFVYKGALMGLAFRLDLLVNDLVVIEIKSVESLDQVHFAQVLTYLRLADKKLGLIINFNSKLLKSGIHRIVNNL